MGDTVYELLKFKSIKDYKDKKGALINDSKNYENINFHKWISVSKLEFKQGIDFGICSVFDILYGGVGLYVSQKLKDEIINAKCTGVIFRELNERYP